MEQRSPPWSRKTSETKKIPTEPRSKNTGVTYFPLYSIPSMGLVYLPTWMVGPYGKSTSPKDSMGTGSLMTGSQTFHGLLKRNPYTTGSYNFIPEKKKNLKNNREGPVFFMNMQLGWIHHTPSKKKWVQSFHGDKTQLVTFMKDLGS